MNLHNLNIKYIFAFVSRFNEFDHKFFGITDAEADQMDPQHKLLLQCSYRALENAGIPMEKASGTRTGVFMGNELFDQFLGLFMGECIFDVGSQIF